MVLGLSPLGLSIIFVLFAGALLSGAIAVMAWRRRDIPGGTPFAAFALFAALWSGTAALQYLSPAVDLAVVLYYLSGIFALVAGILWLVFAIDYSGYGELLTPPVQLLIWIEPVVFTIITVTKPWHDLMPPNPRPETFAGLQLLVPYQHWLVTVQSTISYVAAMLGMGLIGWLAWRTRGGFRRQALTLLVGSLSVLVANVIYRSTRLSLHPGLDPTPLTMVGMSVVIAFALFRQDFLSVAELAPERMFEQFPDPVLVIDEQGRVIETNQAGSAFVEPGDRLSRDLEALDTALGDGEQTVTLTTPMDEERTYDVTVTPLFDPYDRQQGRLVVLRDVTIRKQRERELQAQNDRLDQFAEIVSHDLRNPLNVAAGHTELAAETGDLDHLDRTREALEDMESLIDDVLALARDETVVEPEWTTFESLATDAWPYVEMGSTLVIEADGEVLADPARTAVVLGNLFRNAHEHGSTDVTVWTGVDGDGFYVADDGPGIPEKDRERVFGDGFTTSEDGIGLGLAIIDETAEAHGWAVGVSESRAGGARFDVTGVDVRNVSERPTPESN